MQVLGRLNILTNQTTLAVYSVSKGSFIANWLLENMSPDMENKLNIWLFWEIHQPGYKHEVVQCMYKYVYVEAKEGWWLYNWKDTSNCQQTSQVLLFIWPVSCFSWVYLCYQSYPGIISFWKSNKTRIIIYHTHLTWKTAHLFFIYSIKKYFLPTCISKHVHWHEKQHMPLPISNMSPVFDLQ